jgi:hypothetical protein
MGPAFQLILLFFFLFWGRRGALTAKLKLVSKAEIEDRLDLGIWEVTGCGGAQPLLHSLPRQSLALALTIARRRGLSSIANILPTSRLSFPEHWEKACRDWRPRVKRGVASPSSGCRSSVYKFHSIRHLRVAAWMNLAEKAPHHESGEWWNRSSTPRSHPAFWRAQ